MKHVKVDQLQPTILKTDGEPFVASIGDDLLVSVEFSTIIDYKDCTLEELQAATLDLSLVPEGGIPFPVFSSFYDIQETKIRFVIPITNKLPSGDIYLAGTTPINLGNCVIISSDFGISAQSKFTLELSEQRIAKIDNNLPVVASIYADSTASIYPFGLGDIIDIYVEMTYDVSVLTTPTIEMKLKGKKCF